MTVNVSYEDLATYVDHHKLVASNAIAAANKASAELGELIQALADVGSRVLNGEPGDTDPIVSERITWLIKEAHAFKQINATAGSA